MPTAALTETDRFIVGYRDARTGQPCPPNEKQALAHASSADELLYGGAAFGGKSEYVIQEAIATCLMYAGCEVACFRRTLPELEQSLILRFLRYVPRSIAKYNSQKKRAVFKNGSILWFHYCATDKDVYNYQSAEWVLLLIDQAEQFTLPMATYLFSRVRSAQGYPCKIRLTANPGNRGGPWLKDRYIVPRPEELGDRALPAFGEMWRPVPNPELAADKPLTRQFIQSRMTDNIPGMLADPDYVQRIRANPNETNRRMLEDGDWDVFPGQMFELWRAQKLVTSKDTELLEAGLKPGTVLPWHVIPDPHWRPPATVNVFGSVDYGYGNPWSGHFHAAMPDGHIVTFKEFYATKVRDVHQAERIRDWISEEWAEQKERRQTPWDIPYIVGDLPFGSRMEHGLAKSCYEVYVDHLGIPLGLNIQLAPKGAGSRKARVQRTIGALSPHVDGFPNWQVTTACPNLIRTLPILVADPNDPDDILHGTAEKKQEDHCVAADTPVLTADGWLPIAQVPGAWVSRRNAEVLRIRVDDWSELICTPDQRLLTSEGWQRVDALHLGSEILWWSPLVSKHLGTIASTCAAPTFSGTAYGCTEQSGSTPMVQFRPGFTCITGMATAPTTDSTTSNCSKNRSISLVIPHIRQMLSGTPDERMPSDPVPLVIDVCQQSNGVRRVIALQTVSRQPEVYDLAIKTSLHAYVSARGFLTHNCYDDVSTFLSSRPPFPKPGRFDGSRDDLSTAFGVGHPHKASTPSRLNVAAFGRQL